MQRLWRRLWLRSRLQLRSDLRMRRGGRPRVCRQDVDVLFRMRPADLPMYGVMPLEPTKLRLRHNMRVRTSQLPAVRLLLRGRLRPAGWAGRPVLRLYRLRQRTVLERMAQRSAALL